MTVHDITIAEDTDVVANQPMFRAYCTVECGWKGTWRHLDDQHGTSDPAEAALSAAQLEAQEHLRDEGMSPAAIKQMLGGKLERPAKPVEEEPANFGDLLNSTEIAEIAAVSQTVVSNWKRQHGNFPKPVSLFGGRPVYDRAEIVEWLNILARYQLERAQRAHASALSKAERAEHQIREAQTFCDHARNLLEGEAL